MVLIHLGREGTNTISLLQEPEGFSCYAVAKKLRLCNIRAQLIFTTCIWKTLHLWRIPEQKASMSLAACLLMLLHHNLIPAFDEKPGSTQFIAAPIEIGIFSSISSLEISYFLLAFSIRHLFDSGNYLNASFQSSVPLIFSQLQVTYCVLAHIKGRSMLHWKNTSCHLRAGKSPSAGVAFRLGTFSNATAGLPTDLKAFHLVYRDGTEYQNETLTPQVECWQHKVPFSPGE